MKPEEIKRLSDHVASTNKTQQQLSDLSGVDVSSLSRMLTKEAYDPGWSKVRDLVIAMGWSLDALAGIIPAPKAQDAPSLVEMYERIISNKNKWIRRLSIACVVFFIVLIAIVLYFIWDATHPQAGIIQY